MIQKGVKKLWLASVWQLLLIFMEQWFRNINRWWENYGSIWIFTSIDPHSLEVILAFCCEQHCSSGLWTSNYNFHFEHKESCVGTISSKTSLPYSTVFKNSCTFHFIRNNSSTRVMLHQCVCFVVVFCYLRKSFLELTK